MQENLSERLGLVLGRKLLEEIQDSRKKTSGGKFVSLGQLARRHRRFVQEALCFWSGGCRASSLHVLSLSCACAWGWLLGRSGAAMLSLLQRDPRPVAAPGFC